MDYIQREVDQCLILDIVEHQYDYAKIQLLKHQVAELIHQGHSRIVLNLEKVAMLDSFGIAAIISMLKQCQAAGGNLALFGLNEGVNRLMELTRLDRVLEIWPTEAQAVMQIKARKG
ncbi:MAG: STAS domain-containing protein [Vampirovibrionales bacterium]|nr:STAS domain-containing protein [Vampirovibrionales bacterium]